MKSRFFEGLLFGNLDFLPGLVGGMSSEIIINVVYMAWYVMILRRALSIARAIGRDGPWKSRLFWALKWQ
jgi:hypothetical protein